MASRIKINTNFSNVRENSNNTTIAEAFNKYIKKCEIRNLRPSTIATYKIIDGEFIAAVGANFRVTDICEDTIDDFIIGQQHKGLKDVTINTKIRQIRAFIYFIQEAYNIEKFKISLIKIDEEKKEPYSDEEIKRLIEMPQTDNFVEWRDWCMVNFFLGTGCRLSTALAIKVKHIDFNLGTIFLPVLKNRKQQYLPLSSQLKKVLQDYLSLWDNQKDDFLFPDANHREQLSRHSADATLRKYNYKRNVVTTGIHRFRHTFAKKYIMAGGGALQLQQILGHSSLEVTREYVKLYSIDLQTNFDSFCPLDNL